MTTESVLFGLNKYQLTKETKEQLDQAVAQLQNSKNYVLEVEGFADPTGSAAHNLELSRKRADSVVRYLTVEHNVPLRKINVLGVGEDDKMTEKTREARKQARRVELRVFALDLGGDVNAGNSSNSNTNSNSSYNGNSGSNTSNTANTSSNQTGNTTGSQNTTAASQRE